MGIFSKIKGGISGKANAALDKAIDPEKELDMAILELEEGRKKAMAELLSYKTTAKQLAARTRITLGGRPLETRVTSAALDHDALRFGLAFAAR